MNAPLQDGTIRHRLARHDQLLKGSAWLTVSVAVNALAGFAFWLLAARTYPEAVIGDAAKLFTAVVFVNYATSLGLPIAVGRYANDRSRGAAVLFGWALLVTTVTSAVGTVGLFVLAPADVTAPLDRLGRLAGAVVFCGVVTGMSVAIVVEARLMTLRRWGWVLARVLIVGVVRLPLVGWNPIGNIALWLFILAAALPAASGLVMAGLLALSRQVAFRPVPPNLGAARRFALVNYASVIALQAPQFALPFVVAILVPDSEYSAFYVAFQFATVAFLLPQMLGQVLLIEGGRDSNNLDAQVRIALSVTTGLMGVVAVASFAVAGIVPVVYGKSYEEAAHLLPLLLGAGVAWAVTSIFITRARLVEAESAIIGVALTLAVVILGPGIVLTARNGIEGAATAWFGGHFVAAILAALVGLRLSGAPHKSRDVSERLSS